MAFIARKVTLFFLYRCIKSLKEKGKLVFIIPDTFLNLHMHKGVREFILTSSKIKEIALFPSSYFPGVNFGYANLSIIALEKCSNQGTCLENNFDIVKGFKSVEELNNKKLKHLKRIPTKQSEVYSNDDHAFITTENRKLASIIRNTTLTVGNICDCVTGFLLWQ